MTDTEISDFNQYWEETLEELAGYPAKPEVELLPMRCTEFAKMYSIRLTSIGPYRVFGYLSVPEGEGPFPAIYYAPKYQSVLEPIPQGSANFPSQQVRCACAWGERAETFRQSVFCRLSGSFD